MVSLKYLEDKVAIPATGIKKQISNTKAFISDKDFGVGELCVAESNLIWKKEGEEGLCIEYPNIALHAVSRDLAAFPHECIYVMLDKNILKDENNSDSENEYDESENMTIIRFVPEEKAHLNTIFEAMNQCQALYPDESMSGDEEEDEEDRQDRIGYEFLDDGAEMGELDPSYYNEFTNPDDIELSSKGQEILRRLNINFQNQEQGPVEHSEITSDINNQEQYEDAEGNAQ